MTTVGLSEARNRFLELVACPAGGDEIAITHHGEQVKGLVPPRGFGSPDAPRALTTLIRQSRCQSALPSPSPSPSAGEGSLRKMNLEGRR